VQKQVVRCRAGVLSDVRRVTDVTVVHNPSSRFYQAAFLLPEVRPLKKEDDDTACCYEYVVY
jgi:hypothetical protein